MAKTDFKNGDVLTASDINAIATEINKNKEKVDAIGEPMTPQEIVAYMNS